MLESSLSDKYKRFYDMSTLTTSWRGSGDYIPYIDEINTSKDLLDNNEKGDSMSKPKIKEISNPQKHEYIISCDDHIDLSQYDILSTLSIIKAKLTSNKLAPHMIDIECKMTPTVKTNIISAHKRLKMYGKETPFIACFDEYCNPLPNKLNILNGINIKLIDPEDVNDNEYYLCFISKLNPSIEDSQLYYFKTDKYFSYKS